MNSAPSFGSAGQLPMSRGFSLSNVVKRHGSQLLAARVRSRRGGFRCLALSSFGP